VKYISTLEFDEMARLGFDAMRRVLTESEPSEEDRNKARYALKMASEGTRRMAAETNRARAAFSIAREMQVKVNVMKPVLGNLINASAEEIVENAEPLAKEESTGSRDSRGRRPRRDRTARKRR